jgi:hypothetical protein
MAGLSPTTARPELTRLQSARRQWLSTTAGLVGGALPASQILANTPSPAANARAKSVIVIFNCGAPSHIDLWDPKPLAADNVRGPFATIETNVPGIRVTELIPDLARHADKLAIVRTVHHTHGGHNSGMYWSIVGRPYPIDSTLINPSPSDFPSFGTLLGWLAVRDGYKQPLPPYVITPQPHCDSLVYLTPGQFGGCLGVKYDPFVLNADPNSPQFQVRDMGPVPGISTDRQALRQDLWARLDREGTPIATRGVAELEVFQRQALSLMASSQGAAAFDLTKEPDAVRERYGRHSWGQSHLLARRLVEAGVRIVTTVNGPSITWDTHNNNESRLKNNLVPPMQRAYVALLEDLEERGLLDSTLVIWMGDFGRTPLINKEAGRDHWPGCYSMVLAGGGIQGGQVVGESDKIGAAPWTRPVTPADIHATIFAALGYDPAHLTYHTPDGRPVPLSGGTPVRELLG